MRTEKLAEFTTNSFTSNPLGSIAVATIIGMNLMFLSIMLGANILISMIALLGGILITFGFTVGRTTYTLYHHGIEQTYKRFIPYRLWKLKKTRYIKWEDIRSYKSDYDVGKSFQEYEYLKLRLNKSPFKIWITDQVDRNGFELFRDAFIAKVEGGDTAASVSISENIIPVRKQAEVKTAEVGHIRRSPSFYSTWYAKVITILFVLVVVFFQYFAESFGLSAGSLFKLKFVLIPGVVYLIYRTFIRKSSR